MEEKENNEFFIKEIVHTPSIYYDTLVLSGESSRAFVTLGAIQYAFDNYLLKDLVNYVGTSSGSIICYLLAIGYTPVEIIVYICTNQLMEKMQHFNIVAMIQGRGATSFSSIQEQLEKMSIAKIGYLPTLNDLKFCPLFGRILTLTFSFFSYHSTKLVKYIFIIVKIMKYYRYLYLILYLNITIGTQCGMIMLHTNLHFLNLGII